MTACRKGFGLLLRKLVPPGRLPQVIACGTRGEVYKDFCQALKHGGGECALLLVDSEGPVNPRDGPWSHLRKSDQWTRPRSATEDQVHLMVQCMESWLLADKEMLAAYYGQHFSPASLPRREDIESIPKRDVEAGMKNATRRTQKGEYHKTRHGFDMLAQLDFQEVCAKSPHARRFRDALTQAAETCA